MAMKTEMKVLLYIKRSGQDKDGLSPLMGRIAVRGKNNSIAQFSCKFKVDVKLWNATAQRCTGKSRMAVMANREIERTLLLLRQRFNELKDILFEMSSEWDDELDGRIDRRVRIEYRDRGKFETQFQVASDLLIFRMHTDVFEFDANHLVWQSPYVQADRDNSYCGIIDIYNFLSDSFKFNRNADEGYLIGRIFINRERCYFVEGKRQTSMRPIAFGRAAITREALVGILETAIAYSLDFDLLTPPYEDAKRVTVDQFNTKMDNSKFVTGKRLDYDFDVEDI